MNTAFKIIMAAIYFWLFSITFGGIVGMVRGMHERRSERARHDFQR